MQLAPICLFTYNRLAETQKTVRSLQRNFLASESDLYIFSDGAKTQESEGKVQRVRDYLATIDGFKDIRIIESPTNKGLATSIIDGVSQVLQDTPKVIVIEDDLVTAPNFLDFMNQALHFYQNDSNVLSISGYTMDLPSLPGDSDFYFGYRASSWGWATWKDRWDGIDWQVSDYISFRNNKNALAAFNRGGSDMTRMLANQMKGKIDSWAIRFCYHQFKNNQVTVFPTRSKLQNIGFGEDATHTAGTKRFYTLLDETENRVFDFKLFTEMDAKLVAEFAQKFSIRARLVDKIQRTFSKFLQ